VDARKNRYELADLDEVFGSASKLIACRGKSSVTFDLKADDLDRELLAKKVLGPAGTLRAPTLKSGRTVVVGYSEPAWEEFFGG